MYDSLSHKSSIGYWRYIIYGKINAVNLFVLVNMVGGGGDSLIKGALAHP